MDTKFNNKSIPIQTDPHINLIHVDYDLNILTTNYSDIISSCIHQYSKYNKNVTIDTIDISRIKYINNQHVTFMIYAMSIDTSLLSHDTFIDIFIDRSNGTYQITSIYIK